ncbi:hypothetical protein [Sphaerotilus microaerophilus]|jgi:hypothetical protein|uniref:Uncharacterized protein n=1 Tax=Sphaerotilus microaerophilus TaxID=2914710 RepID=A0ABN6PG53_9BURK|nr:hypothetical protein [Sphaerotilus sp. FB-5]BDI03328.1 hypothetical protein CATMQ487_02980 [Sphaerotilus sp. FB-5]
MEPSAQNRLRIAQRIHDLLLHELGEAVDVGLLLGPPEYARAVLSLCRSCGSTELVQLGNDFVHATDAEARVQRQAGQARSAPEWRVPTAGELPIGRTPAPPAGF